MYVARMISSQAISIALLLLFSSSIWFSRGQSASVPPPHDATLSSDDISVSRLRRQASLPSLSSACLPATTDELSAQLQSTSSRDSIQAVPVMHEGKLITMGMSWDVNKILSNNTLARCIKSIKVDKDVSRFPSHILLTECDLEKEGCSNVRLQNKPKKNGSEQRFIAAVLKQDGCSETTGKEKWSVGYVSLPQCVITSM